MASSSVDPSLLGHPPSGHVDMNYSENEDEVDQLDSDSDTNLDASGAPIQSSELGNDNRLPGHSQLPVTRLENIIQADGT